MIINLLETLNISGAVLNKLIVDGAFNVTSKLVKRRKINILNVITRFVSVRNTDKSFSITNNKIAPIMKAAYKRLPPEIEIEGVIGKV